MQYPSRVEYVFVDVYNIFLSSYSFAPFPFSSLMYEYKRRLLDSLFNIKRANMSSNIACITCVFIAVARSPSHEYLPQYSSSSSDIDFSLVKCISDKFTRTVYSSESAYTIEVSGAFDDGELELRKSIVSLENARRT